MKLINDKYGENYYWMIAKEEVQISMKNVVKLAKRKDALEQLQRYERGEVVDLSIPEGGEESAPDLDIEHEIYLTEVVESLLDEIDNEKSEESSEKSSSDGRIFKKHVKVSEKNIVIVGTFDKQNMKMKLSYIDLQQEGGQA